MLVCPLIVVLNPYILTIREFYPSLKLSPIIQINSGGMLMSMNRTLLLLSLFVSMYPNFASAMELALQEKQKIVTVGVDIGGTNTDAVLLFNNQLLCKCKVTTTSDITTGIVSAISELFLKHPDLKRNVSSINIGTTHLLNALLERKGLIKPLVLRLAAPATNAALPGIDWQPDLKEKLLDEVHVEKGGYEYNGTVISALDEQAIARLAEMTLAKKIKAAAITGVFSNVNSDQEIAAQRIFNRINPDVEVSLSHTMGDLGLLARENATILNACLAVQYRKIRDAFKQAIASLGINTRVYLTFGDGTKTSLDDGLSTPLRTLHSGPINSIKGAATLAQVADAVTMDIGGTSTDIGFLKSGEPVSENSYFATAGINCNFSSARLHSFALGGGSIIKVDANGKIAIGPESVGKDLSSHSLVFKGNTLTLTDIAVALGRLDIGVLNREELKQKIAQSVGVSLNNVDTFIQKVDRAAHEKLILSLTEAIGAMEDVPQVLVLVGGGASLFDINQLRTIHHFKSIILPAFADVANALGAAQSLIGGKYVQVYNYSMMPRAQAIADATEKAKVLAIKKGAKDTSIKVVGIRETPLTYLQGDPNQLTVNVAGLDGGDSAVSQAPDITSRPMENIAGKPSSIQEKNTKVTQEQPVDLAPAVELQGLETLSMTDIDDISKGAALLGSGGGGNPEIGRLLAQQAIKKGAAIKRISLDNLPDNALVVTFGGAGSVTVFYERLASVEEGAQAIRAIETRLKKKVDAILLLEAGGANATYPLFVAGMLNKPVIDGDCMGRAFPGIDKTTLNIYGTFDTYYMAFSNGLRSELVETTDFKILGQKAVSIFVEMGGTVSCAGFPLTGANVKKLAIKGTLSLAQRMGKALRESEGQPFNKRLEMLNMVLGTTEYQKAKKIFEGKIINLRRKESGGFSIGGLTIANSATNERLEIGFQNENLVARKQGTREIVAQVPDLISIVDGNNFRVISCEDLRYGQNVIVLTMSAPALMKTEKALAFVGPQVYPMDQLFALFTQ